MKPRNVEILLVSKDYLQKRLMKDSGDDYGDDRDSDKPEKYVPFEDKYNGEDNDEEKTTDYKQGYKDGFEAAMEELKKHKSGGKKEKSLLRMIKQMFAGPGMCNSSSLYNEIDGISVITIDGELAKRTNDPSQVDVDAIQQALTIAGKAETKAVLLHINSPGGSSVGIEETADMIAKLTEIKPVFTYVDTLCASAAYWLAACSNSILCSPSSNLGSIGVFAKIVDLSENFKMQGINVQVIQAGSMKTMGQPEKPLDDNETAYIQNEINEQWTKFKTHITSYRGTVEEENMQGQLFEGEKAIDANLADQLISTLDEAIALIASGE